MQKTLLYIEQPHYNKNNGGAKLDFRNERLLKEIFQKRFIFIQIPEPTFFQKVFQKLFCISDGYSRKVRREIKKALYENEIDIIFIPSSRYGALIKQCKVAYSSCTTVCYFANIEYEFASEFAKWHDLKSLLLLRMCKKNELLAAKFSDYTIGLTPKDNALLRKYYKRDFDLILPTTFADRFHGTEIVQSCIGKNALFVGANFFGNTEGLDWFISEVLPELDITLTIVGAGMDMYKVKSPKVKVYGFVDDLDSFYQEADFMLSPIISGGGMKTKISEAMMFGKVILGTDIAFEGYDIADLPECIVCNTKSDFIKEIKALPEKKFLKFNQNVRNKFLVSYSDEAAKKLLTDFFYGLE